MAFDNWLVAQLEAAKEVPRLAATPRKIVDVCPCCHTNLKARDGKGKKLKYCKECIRDKSRVRYVPKKPKAVVFSEL